MRILLVAVNAKYIHSNLALLSLKAYASKYKESIKVKEYTINHYQDYILGDIYKEKPDFIGFSCYVWNIDVIRELALEVHKVLPHAKLWFGGPEVSFDGLSIMKESSYLSGVMVGEGEQTFLELMEYYLEDKVSLKEVKGIVYRNQEDGEIVATGTRSIMNLSEVPFPYEDWEPLTNKIIYYESSRGCPYSCSYCLSSIDKKIRFRSMDLVKEELSVFLKRKVPQVKFIDRTFNCNRGHALEIWKFIQEYDNGITNFHFEISAHLLGEEELNLLGSLRPGLVQLEIGVQSTNPQTLAAVNRNMNQEQLSYAVKRIGEGQNIHQHLDLIAGLPFEGYQSFRKSFNEVYALKPDQLQLGFLKVLKGSVMFEESKDYGIVYKGKGPYEVLYTKWLSYEEVRRLKVVEEMVEVYYNSGQFRNSIGFLEHFFEDSFELYQGLGDYYVKMGLLERSHSRVSRYEYLEAFYISYVKDYLEEFREIMVYDLYLREKLKSRPAFAKNNDNVAKQYKRGLGEQKGKMMHVEKFSIFVEETVNMGYPVHGNNLVIFDYERRHALHNQAITTMIKDGFK